MATWPESSPTPNYPLSITPRFKTLISDLDSGNESRRAKWQFPKFDVRVTYDMLTKTEMGVLYAFCMARSGPYEGFYIYDLGDVLIGTGTSHEDMYVGTGDGSTTIFDLPGRSTSAHDIYLAGVEESESNYTILTGGGSSSADRVEFDTAPDAGVIITADFFGYQRMRVRYDGDRGISRDLFQTIYYRTGGIDLVGLGPEL